MDNLLKYETQVETFLQEGSSPGLLPFPNGLESESPEAELWSRVHLSYAISLKLGGCSTAFDQWADARTGLLLEYVPKKTWLLSQTELKGLKQRLVLRMQSCQYDNFQRNDENEVITPLTLFCHAVLCFAYKDKELFDEKLLPADVTWPELVCKIYSPIWREGIEFVCTKVTNETDLLPMALHILSEVSVMYKHFIKLSIPFEKDSSAWLYEPQQLKTISSCCKDAISSYFDNMIKLQLCEDLDQMSSTEKTSSITQQVDNCVYGAKVLIQTCWRLCNDIDHVMLIVNGKCLLAVQLQSLCADAISHATSTCFQKLSEWYTTDVSQRIPYHSWYVVLSSLLYMSGRLRHHVTHSAAHWLAAPLQQCSKLVDRIQSDVVNYHIELCRNGLLHDGRSHHWQDNRPFYEGERCSFTIQMWAYHLRAFKHDLWRVFAYDVASKLLGAVLAEGLIILSQRYRRVKPSMRRLPQMKADILMVLLTSASLLPHLFPLPCLDTHHLYVTSCVINSCCMSLLHDLTLVCADLKALVDHVMQNVITANGLRSFSDCTSDWLHHAMLHCHVDFPSTYIMDLTSSGGGAANCLLHLCGLSTMNERLLIKVLVANSFLFSRGLVEGGTGVLSELAHVLCHCSHTPSGLCVVLEQAGNKECTDWLISYLQPYLLWCLLPKAVLFTKWMAKFLHDEVTTNDNDSSRKALVELFSGVLEQICDLLPWLPSPVCLLISRLSPASTLLGRLLRSMFSQSHNQLFYNFVNILAGLLDGSMLFDVPASIADLLSLCKADFTPIITTLNDTSIATDGICNDALCDDSEHMIVAELLKETSKGRKCLELLFNTIVSNQDELLQWCKKGGVTDEALPFSAPLTYVDVKSFCPTKEFCQIGEVSLDHTRLLKASLDWRDLLNVIWPQLSEEVLTSCLGNRWEFQEGAWLNDEETQLVDIIKKKLVKNNVT